MTEQNIHNLKRAIAQLPVYEPDQGLWFFVLRAIEALDKEEEQLEYEEQGYVHLRKAIQALEVYAPSEELWNNIIDALKKGQHELGREYLKHAIAELPEHHPAADQWVGILIALEENSESGRDHLKDAIGELPDLNVDDSLWAAIEAELPTEGSVSEEQEKTELDRAVLSLPVHTPDQDLWSKIESGLDEGKVETIPIQTAKPSKKRFVWRPLLAAASLILLLALGAVINMITLDQQQIIPVADNGPSISIQIEETEEIASADTWNSGLFQVESKSHMAPAEDMIEAYCSDLPPACQHPHFRAMRDQLIEVEEECTKLRDMLAKDATDAITYTFLVRLEKQKDQITKELIQIILS